MARKSIKGYAEKNYYDNTKFSGGIVATNDSLNEGYFKHLVNFDISDTGQSLIPRKGFITTMFKNGEDYWAPSNNSIYFYDEALGKYIFYGYGSDPYIVDFVLGDKYLNAVDIISNVDITDLRGLYGYNLKYMNPIGTNKAIRVKDEYNITCYIIKMSVTLNSGGHDNLYLKLYYNKQDDTLVVSYLDTDQIVNYVDTNYRNLASSKSVIPDPMQEIYPNDNIPIGHYDQFPMIYIQNDDGKYLINEIKDVTSFKVIPNFYLAEDEREDYTWGYTYEIFSTNKDLQYTEDTLVYKSPIYYFNGEVVYSLYSLYDHLKYMSLSAWSDILKLDTPVEAVKIYENEITSDVYIEYFTYLNKYNISSIFPEYVIYAVPLQPSPITYTINFSKKDLIGDYGLLSHFDNSLIHGKFNNELVSIQEAEEHNKVVEEGSIISANYMRDLNPSTIMGSSSLEDALDKMLTYNWGVYVRDINNIKDASKKFQDSKDTFLNSFIFAWDEEPMDVTTFKQSTIYSDIISKSPNVIIKVLPCRSDLHCYKGDENLDTSLNPTIFTRLFTDMSTEYTSKTYILTYLPRSFLIHDDYTPISPYVEPDAITYNTDEYASDDAILKDHGDRISHPFYSLFYKQDTTLPLLVHEYIKEFPIHEYNNIFTLNNGVLVGDFNNTKDLHNYFLNNHFYDLGLLLNFYLVKLPKSEYLGVIKDPFRDSILAQSPKLMQARQLNKVTYEPTTYIEYLTEEPELIKNAEGMVKYDSMLGSHLVLYTGNKLFISKEGMQYYFFNYNTFDFPEEIVKVIQYKEILLVFTTQDLYAVYLEEVTTEVLNGYNEDGTPKYTQQKSYEFRSQVVLYNLMVDKRYIDAIQVYNQMVLFYSSDGQMFLIKPTAAITSDTRFSIQYFNKSANDILLNYKDYMQRRLQEYGIDDTIENVDIKVSATLNYIKIFYSASELITYILVYDVINNRYYVYDTVSFTSIKYLHYTPIGELYITEHKGKFYFTLPYTNIYDMDNNVDVNCYDYFNPYPINAEIDTGTINLNNHLKKRFKDLHVIYKNLNANSVEFAVETFVDDIPIVTYVSNSFEVRDVNGAKTLTIVESNKVKELIDHTSLLSFIDYTSNKIITHRTNIISRGKTIRVKMNFKSKGRYKIQGFGLIYKEHTV